MAETVTSQPQSHPELQVPQQNGTTQTQQISRNFRARLTSWKEKVTTREGWLGEYDFRWLCTPTLPSYSSTSKSTGPKKRIVLPPPFYALEAEIPILLGLVCGLQHALAMLAGLITPPILFASALNLDPALQAYMISASLIGCGWLSLIQMSHTKLFAGYYLGTGLLSVVGTSFATLSTAFSIFDNMYANGTCPSTTNPDGSITRGPCPDAYGYLIGTSLVCSFLEWGISFVPVRILRRVFPPLVTGTVVLLIGASLIGSSGIPNWGGGSNDCMSFPTSGFFQLCPDIAAPRPLPWGSAEFIGLGFLSFVSIVLTEVFGSPFLKNGSVIVGLAVGCIVAGATGYIDGSSITTAPRITFLWVHTFRIRVYGPAVLPLLAVYISLAMEAIGDITASAEVSRLAVAGPEFDSRIQGGILSDGLGGCLSALFTVAPLSVFAQNNGVIAITRCANRTAGRYCCMFLIIFGTLGKLSGVFLAIPNPVLGGVTTFLFATVASSGIRVLSYMTWTRRDRFILAAALTLGAGDLLVPGIFTHLFDRVPAHRKTPGLQGLFDSITIILSTPFLVAGLTATILNLILPPEIPPLEGAVLDDHVAFVEDGDHAQTEKETPSESDAEVK